MTSSYSLNILLLGVLILLGMLAILQMHLQLQVVFCHVRHSLVLGVTGSQVLDYVGSL